MLDPQAFLSALLHRGFDLYSGVPCSYLTSLINCVIDSKDSRYVGATNEGDAVAVAAGAWVGGRRSAVLFQNSGLGNAVNPLSSLVLPARIPLLILATWRGEPGGAPDEPQHEIMGRVTPEIFASLDIPCLLLDSEPGHLEATLDQATSHLDAKQTPCALLIRKGTFAPHALRATLPQARPPLLPPPDRVRVDTRLDPDVALAAVREGAGEDAALVATTGFTGRALYSLGDRPNQLYMVGSMGCASSFGLGLALARPDRRVVVIDGDGALLMRMGALATIGFEAPANLVHVLLDNGVHDSTGAQATVSREVDLAGVAAACGYRLVSRVGDAGSLQAAVHEPAAGPVFVSVATQPRLDRKLPRPELGPDDVARRLADWLEAAP